jgi:peroxiredoxin
MNPNRPQPKSLRGRLVSPLPQIGGAIGAVVAVLGFIWFNNFAGPAQPASSGSMTRSGPGGFRFSVGVPGPGEDAPAIVLPASTGGNFDLAAQHGKWVLLFFQEGLTCQPCWDQITEIEKKASDFRILGISKIVSVTADPLDLIKQKTLDMHLSTPVLSDPDLVVSKAYHTNDYGMMGKARNGHSFILVGPDGKISWRADYGGPPDYTMYIPAAALLKDIYDGVKSERNSQ